MPRIQLLVPCEKVIENRLDGGISLINLFPTLSVQTVGPIERGTAVPFKWHLFVYWLLNPGDDGNKFQHRVEIISPRGNVEVEQTASFTVLGHHHHHRTTINVEGFPISEDGAYTIRLHLLDLNGNELEQASCPMLVQHRRGDTDASVKMTIESEDTG